MHSRRLLTKLFVLFVKFIYLLFDDVAVTHDVATPQDLEECLALKASRIPVEENCQHIINLSYFWFL